MPADTALNLQAYDGSMPPGTDSTSVLILGTPHLAQSDRGYSPREIDRGTEALSAYNPDMLIVEYLPPDHPRGKGRDYRPAFNLDSLATAWDPSLAEADARWFIHGPLLDALSTGQVWALWNFWPIIPRVSGNDQERRAHAEGHRDCYPDALRFNNSPEWMGLQYWTYEDRIRRIDWKGVDMGAEQVEHYWRRNRKMFERMQDAIEARDAERVLVIVGSGHKYFLDELTREAGYRWIDPRDWLPASCSGKEWDRSTAE